MDKIYLILFTIVIVYIIYKCFCISEYENFTTDPKSLSDIDAIKNLAAVAKDLQTVNGLKLPGSLSINGDIFLEGATIQKTGEGAAGRMHINGDELLYLLNKNGVMIGKEWGGNGNLQVQGNVNANNKLTVGGAESGYAIVNIRNGDGRYTHIGVTGQADRKFQNGSLFRGNVHMDNDLNIDGNQRIEGNISMGGNSTFSVDAPGVVGGRFTIDKDGNVTIKGKLTVKDLVVEDNLDLGKDKRSFYKFNGGNDYVELHGLPYFNRACNQGRRGIHTGCNLERAVS